MRKKTMRVQKKMVLRNDRYAPQRARAGHCPALGSAALSFCRILGEIFRVSLKIVEKITTEISMIFRFFDDFRAWTKA